MRLDDFIKEEYIHYHLNDVRDVKSLDLAPVHVCGDVRFAEKFEYEKLTRNNAIYSNSGIDLIKNCLIVGRSMVIDYVDNKIISSSVLNGRFNCERKWVEVKKNGAEFSVKFVGDLGKSINFDLKDRKCAFMLGNTGSYQHWFMEILPLISYYKGLLENDDLDFILINKDTPAYQIEIYKSLGIFDKIFFVDETNPYLVGEMVVGVPLSINSMWINPEIINFFEWVKKKLLIDHAGYSPEKIVIGRAELAKKREIKNFSKVEVDCVKRGYEIVYPEKMSLYEKIKLFSSCKKLVGQAGGGMSHLVFSDALETAIILAPNNFPINTFREICSIKKIECVYFLTESFDNFVGGRLDSNSYANFGEFQFLMNKYG